MNTKEYTLDRFEGDYAIFLKRPEETEQLAIHRREMNGKVQEGDIVDIQDNGMGYHITVLKDTTAKKKEHVKNLLNELKSKNN
ncbi:DUF3006 domain-containing protein [Lysinibacillus yapensis]|uniref:DUF3006 domain-containing protein n=1 Tax=Ureibacillus yapensis TaxID=2304605 RepID=A0A396SEG4_9BACL|nr:DUF3006 domain-containing protein [Lysinibacillus yapensis]RHW36602.1 DUF3006 domain-containing protein [Lysinibacillus yapensis]